MNYKEARERLRLIQQQKLQEVNEQKCSEILQKIACSRMETVFVGAVSKIEHFFGSLWGELEGVDESKMTSDQKKWFNKFLDLREAIFDQGNTEKNRITKDINNFKISLKETKIQLGQQNGRSKKI
jgi:hypothetical protein